MASSRFLIDALESAGLTRGQAVVFLLALCGIIFAAKRLSKR